jgi:hypothetical protein
MSRSGSYHHPRVERGTLLIFHENRLQQSREMMTDDLRFFRLRLS